MLLKKSKQSFLHDLRRIFASQREYILATDPGLQIAPPQQCVERLFNKFRLALFDDNDCLLVSAKFNNLIVNHRVGNIHHIKRNFAFAISI